MEGENRGGGERSEEELDKVRGLIKLDPREDGQEQHNRTLFGPQHNPHDDLGVTLLDSWL